MVRFLYIVILMDISKKIKKLNEIIYLTPIKSSRQKS